MAQNPGPIPKRSEERIRRNIPEVPIDKVTVIGKVPVPPLGLEEPHPFIVDMYQSLSESGQAKYYEPSDWQYARFTLHFADSLLKSSRPSAQLLASVNQMLSNLLVSEGDRRRVRLEVERNQSSEGEGKVLQVADMFRSRLQG